MLAVWCPCTSDLEAPFWAYFPFSLLMSLARKMCSCPGPTAHPPSTGPTASPDSDGAACGVPSPLSCAATVSTLALSPGPLCCATGAWQLAPAGPAWTSGTGGQGLGRCFLGGSVCRDREAECSAAGARPGRGEGMGPGGRSPGVRAGHRLTGLRRLLRGFPGPPPVSLAVSGGLGRWGSVSGPPEARQAKQEPGSARCPV